MSLGFTFDSEDELRCDTCGKVVQRGIANLVGHFAECWGKGLVDNVHKIDKMPLSVKDKMDLVKKEFNINH